MLLRQTLLYLPAQVVGPLFQFVSILAWTHFLSPESMGVFALVMATQELAYTVTLFWFTLYTMRYYHAGGAEADRRRFLDTEMAVLLASAAASVMLVLLLIVVVDTHWTPSVVLASLAHIVTRAAVTHLTDRARTEHDTLTYTALQTLWPILGLVFGVVLVELFARSVAMVLWGYTLAQVLSLAVAAARLELGWRPLAFDREMIRMSLRYGIPLLFGAVFIWVAVNGIRFVVEFQSGAAAVGLITVGWMLGFRATMFAAMLVTAAAFPLAVKISREAGMAAGQEQLERNGVLLLIALLPAAAGLWLVAEPFIQLVVAEPYRSMTVTILPMSILAGVFRTFRIHFAEQVFLLREQPTMPLINDIVDAILAVAGVLGGIALGGLPGSVVGAALAAFASLLFTMVVGWKMHRYGVPPIDVLKVLGATGSMAIAVAMLPIPASVAGIATAATAGAAAYGVALALLYPQGGRRVISVLRTKLATGSG